MRPEGKSRERDSAILSPMVCENCFVLLCSKFPLHNAFAKGPFAIGRGQGQCPVALLLPLFNLHFYFCALESVTVCSFVSHCGCDSVGLLITN